MNLRPMGNLVLSSLSTEIIFQCVPNLLCLSCFLFVVVSHRWPAELLSAAVVQQFFLSCIPLPQRHNQHCLGLSSGQRQLCFGARCSELCQFSLLIVCGWVYVWEKRRWEVGSWDDFVFMLFVAKFDLFLVSTYAQVQMECAWLCCTKTWRKE